MGDVAGVTPVQGGGAVRLPAEGRGVAVKVEREVKSAERATSGEAE